MDPAGGLWLDLFSKYGSFGLVCFVLWWMLTKMQPRFEDALRGAQLSYKEALESQAGAHRDLAQQYLQEKQKARTDFIEALKSEHEALRAERESTRQNFRELSDRLDRLMRLLVYLYGREHGRALSKEELEIAGAGPPADAAPRS